MRLCRVVGSVWGAKEADSLRQQKLLELRPVSFAPGGGVLSIAADEAEPPLQEGIVVALDRLGAGVGEYVLVAHGSRVRDLTVGPALPDKDIVVAIVDRATADCALFPDGEERR